jgi:hypothetical protein
MINQLKLAILRSLANVNPYLMPEQTLFADASLQMAAPPTLTEFRAALAELEKVRRVVSCRDEDNSIKWKITDNGLARLSELQ